MKIVSRQIRGFHEVVISDNGKGFEPEELDNATGTHIGIPNVRERVEQMCGGTLTIESKADVGTTVTIRIPVRQNKRLSMDDLINYLYKDHPPAPRHGHCGRPMFRDSQGYFYCKHCEDLAREEADRNSELYRLKELMHRSCP